MSEPGVCMAYDAETGNAYDYFEDTPEALEARAKRLRGLLTVTDSPHVASVTSSVAVAVSEDRQT